MWQLLFTLLLAFPRSQAAQDISTVVSATPTGLAILALGSAAPILVIVFTCNHCPIAQMYEQRIQQLEADYQTRGVAVVAIEPNDPKALRVDELGSSDISDSLDEMKIRFEYKHLHYPYLYDGETQSVTRAYGPQAMPHVFVFDKDRKLRYEGRMDNSFRMEMVNTQDAQRHRRFAGKPRGVRKTGGRLWVLDQVERKKCVQQGDLAKDRGGAGKTGNGSGQKFEASS
jgi:thiol-disulfide isomerase/thioredoxin